MSPCCTVTQPLTGFPLDPQLREILALSGPLEEKPVCDRPAAGEGVFSSASPELCESGGWRQGRGAGARGGASRRGGPQVLPQGHAAVVTTL